jgi:membrane peptidoglycan carboxypeptidase
VINYPRSEKTGLGKLIPSWKLVLGGLLTLAVVGAGMFAIAVYILPVPQPNDVAIAETTKVMYADGKTEVGRIGDVRRTSVPLEEVPLDVQHAVLAAEDRSFYDHGGFSPEGISRALWNNVTGGSTQGGSTITQQYVKNAYLTQDQNILRKANELVLAVKLETIESKDEILSNYLNTIYFGRGAYGIEAASEVYFGKPVNEMTPSEGAALAAVIQSPGNYEPELFEERLMERWNYVLDGMVEKEWLTPAERADMTFPKFKKQEKGNQLAGQAGYILETVKDELVAKGWSEAEIDGGGLTITTTIKQQAQDAAVAAVENAGPTYNTEGLRVGLIAVEPETRRIAAMYGGENYLKTQLNNATQGRAQGGSTFKAFGLAAALDEGYSLDTVLNGSSPATIEGYTLQNFGNSSFGPVSLLTATTNSVNTAYVQLESEVGVDKTIATAEKLGLPADTPGIEDNLTFVLGSPSPRPIDMANSFATFAARGMYAEPTILKEVTRNTGEVAYRSDDSATRVFDEDVMDNVNYALQTVVNNGTATRASWTGRPAAGKTGTTDDNMSAWFVGYTPQLSAAVMLAKENKKGNPISLNGTGGVYDITGGSFPTAIWAEFMSAALADEPVEYFVAPGSDVPPGQTSTDPYDTYTESPSSEPSASPSATDEPSPSSSTSATPEPSQPLAEDPQPRQQPTDPELPDPRAEQPAVLPQQEPTRRPRQRAR